MATKLIYFVAFIDVFCIALVVPLIVPTILNYGGSVFTTGLTESVCAALQFIGAPIVGSWSDSAGRKTVFYITVTISLFSNFLLANSGSLALFLVARIINSAFHHVQILIKAITVDHVQEKDQGMVFNNMAALLGLAFTFGPILGGNLFAVHGDFYYIVLIANTLYLLCIGAVFLLDEKKSPSSSKSKRGVIENIRQVNWKMFWDLFLFKLSGELTFSTWRSTFSILLREEFQISTKNIGYVIGFLSANSLLSNLFMPKIQNRFYPNDKNGTIQLKQGLIVHGASLIIMALTRNFWIYILCNVPFIFSKTLLNTIWMKILLNRIKNKDKGVIIGASDSIVPLSDFISPLTVGIVGETLSLQFSQYLPLVALSASLPLITTLGT